VMSYVAIRLTRRSPTAKRSYGYHRATIVSALANVALVLVVAVVIAAEALGRIHHPGHVNGGVVAIVAGCAALLDLLAARLVGGHSHDVNLRANAVHLAGDAVTSIAVVIVGIIVATSHHLAVLDPAISLAIALVVAVRGVAIGREAVDILLEASPLDVDLDELRATIASVPGVAEVHDLHFWSLSSDVRALSAHVVVAGHPSLEEAQLVGEAVKTRIGQPFEIAHATLELECERCVEPDANVCSIDEPAHAHFGPIGG